jgi:four helix bundle protein
MLRFEKLDVWHRSIDYADKVYDAAESFPRKEQFGLTSQLTRAALSISSNLAEGSSRVSSKDFSRFVEIAFGSLCESVSLLCMARRRQYIDKEQHAELYKEAEELTKMLSAFRNSLGKWKPEDVDK